VSYFPVSPCVCDESVYECRTTNTILINLGKPSNKTKKKFVNKIDYERPLDARVEKCIKRLMKVSDIEFEL